MLGVTWCKMPLLDANYISNLYFFNDSISDKTLVLENFTEHQKQLDVTPKPLIQGNIGTYVIDVHGMKWECEMSSPVFIMQNSGFENLLDIIYDGYLNNNFILNAVGDTTPEINTILKTASINIGQDGVKTTMTCWSDKGSVMNWLVTSPVIADAAPDGYSDDFIGRIARFYDTYLILNFDQDNTNIDPQTYYIKSGDIKIEVITTDTFFIRQSKKTYNPNTTFRVLNYTVEGNVTIAYSPLSDPLVNPIEIFQQSTNGAMFQIVIGNSTYDFSKGKIVIREISKTIKSDDLVWVTLSFHSTVTK